VCLQYWAVAVALVSLPMQSLVVVVVLLGLPLLVEVRRLLPRVVVVLAHSAEAFSHTFFLVLRGEQGPVQVLEEVLEAMQQEDIR
jgi:hypothetical protein